MSLNTKLVLFTSLAAGFDLDVTTKSAARASAVGYRAFTRTKTEDVARLIAIAKAAVGR